MKTISINEITPRFMEDHTIPLKVFKGWEVDDEKGRENLYKEMAIKKFAIIGTPGDFKCEVNIIKHKPDEYWVRYEGETTWDTYVKDDKELRIALQKIVAKESKGK